jgi:plastocyanin
MLIPALILHACGESSAPPAARPVTPVNRDTAGTIRATVKYRGSVPVPKEISMAGTPECAAAHKEPVYEESLIVKEGRLKNAVVWIKDGLGDRAFTIPDRPVQIDQRGCIYRPHVVTAMVGQPVEFLNSDPLAHNVHGHPERARAWNFMMPRPNTARSVTFDKAEVAIPVRCDIHPWMLSYVAVVEHPYSAVTADDGSAELSLVPPGVYVVGVWHETLGVLEQTVTLAEEATEILTFTYERK